MVVFRLPETVARAMVVGVAGPCRNLIALNAVSGHGQALASLGGIGESEAGIVATPRGFPRSVVVLGIHNGGPYRDFGLCSMAAYLCLSSIPAPYQGTGHAFDRRNGGTCGCDGERPSSSRCHERSAQPSSGAVGCYCVACQSILEGTGCLYSGQRSPVRWVSLNSSNGQSRSLPCSQ